MELNKLVDPCPYCEKRECCYVIADIARELARLQAELSKSQERVRELQTISSFKGYGKQFQQFMEFIMHIKYGSNPLYRGIEWVCMSDKYYEDIHDKIESLTAALRCAKDSLYRISIGAIGPRAGAKNALAAIEKMEKA